MKNVEMTVEGDVSTIRWTSPKEFGPSSSSRPRATLWCLTGTRRSG